MSRPNRILVVDDDASMRRLLESTLTDAGFAVTAAENGQQAIERAVQGNHDLLVLDLVLPAPDGISVLRVLRSRDETRELPVVVLTARDGDEEIARAFEAGADDLVRKPVRPAELLARIRGQLRMRSYVEELARKEKDAQVMVELTQALASSLDFREILYTVVRRIAEVVRVDRVSIVLAPEEGNVGFVVAASDDEQLSNLKLDLAKYPEIQQVLRTRDPLMINDVATHPVLDGVRADVQNAKLSSLALLPIVWEEQAMGVLFLRTASPRGDLSDREIGFCRVVANATAVALRNARVMQSLRDHTQQITFARFEAERRLRSLKRYADLFASSADGIAVVDMEGRLLFANPRAFELTGYSESELVSRKLREIIHAGDAERARMIWEGFASGAFPRAVDLRIVRKDASAMVINCSFSALGGEDAVLLTFRDVTEERHTAAELVQTKEFLESLIDASVDAIVAADMRGNIILFNKGAEHVYGYRSADVVGKMHVTILYPEGGARDIMRMLRAPHHGGVGRLDGMQTEALDANGARIPITLSASFIYEGGKPVATFGIFKDLREKIHVEERLAQAQQKLAVTEKQALIAEMAGAFAHELNQPLTSVTVYAELLKRKLSRDTQEHHAVDMILRESERMADIVRKIGKITKYETKSYVGQQKILDLDRATGEASPSIPPTTSSSVPPKRD